MKTTSSKQAEILERCAGWHDSLADKAESAGNSAVANNERDRAETLRRVIAKLWPEPKTTRQRFVYEGSPYPYFRERFPRETAAEYEAAHEEWCAEFSDTRIDG